MASPRVTRCWACNSPHRAEIDAALISGKSARNVERWLQETHGQRIGYHSLAIHKRTHIPELLQIRERVAAEASAAAEEAVDYVVADIHFLDYLAGHVMYVLELLKGEMGAPTIAQATAWSSALREGRELVKQRHDMTPREESDETDKLHKLIIEHSFPERPPLPTDDTAPTECPSGDSSLPTDEPATS